MTPTRQLHYASAARVLWCNSTVNRWLHGYNQDRQVLLLCVQQIFDIGVDHYFSQVLVLIQLGRGHVPNPLRTLGS